LEGSAMLSLLMFYLNFLTGEKSSPPVGFSLLLLIDHYSYLHEVSATGGELSSPIKNLNKTPIGPSMAEPSKTF
jgi:hypothetical protein